MPPCPQALRHFYVLATQPRCAQAVDVDIKQPVHLPLALVVAEQAVTCPGSQQSAAAAATNVLTQSSRQNLSHEEEVWPTPMRRLRRSSAGTSGGGAAPPGHLLLERGAPCLLPERAQVRNASVHLTL